jgi:hypothetical protein
LIGGNSLETEVIKKSGAFAPLFVMRGKSGPGEEGITPVSERELSLSAS